MQDSRRPALYRRSARVGRTVTAAPLWNSALAALFPLRALRPVLLPNATIPPPSSIGWFRSVRGCEPATPVGRAGPLPPLSTASADECEHRAPQNTPRSLQGAAAPRCSSP